MKLSIIIPVYNEENLIGEVIGRILDTRFPSPVTSTEIIVADDCSTDLTAERAETSLKGKVPGTVIRLPENRGKGAAVRAGIEQCTGEIIVIQDADLELIPSDISAMIETMDRLNIEFVNGSRYMPGIIRPLYSYRRYFFNKVFTRLAAVLINTQLTDLACGYKLFTRNIYNQVRLKENRFGFEAELLLKVIRLKKTLIAEVPVHYFPRNTGDGKKIRNIDGLRIFWVILKYGFFKVK